MFKLFKRKRKVPWPIPIKDAIDLIFNHNAIVNLWTYDTPDSEKRIYHSMAWQIPNEYHNWKIHKVMGLASESLNESDAINLLVAPSDERGDIR